MFVPVLSANQLAMGRTIGNGISGIGDMTLHTQSDPCAEIGGTWDGEACRADYSVTVAANGETCDSNVSYAPGTPCAAAQAIRDIAAGQTTASEQATAAAARAAKTAKEQQQMLWLVGAIAGLALLVGMKRG